MNILHILSNRKWTERSEPVADLVLAQQALGHNAMLACGKWTLESNHESSAEVQAKNKGIDPIILHLDKHFNWSNMRKDVPAISALIDEQEIDVLHTHMENGHLLAALARRKSTRKPTLINSCYTIDGPKRGLRSNALYRHATDACTVIEEQARAAVISRHHLPPERVVIIEPGIDLSRFHPNRFIGDAFQANIPPQAITIGMVTRIRSDRRVDLAVSALEQLKDSIPTLHLLLVGHGEEEHAIREQVQQAGLEDRVIWGGYCRDDQLALAYRSMDLLMYPIPGTDQSCRTVREALAAGVPVIASHTGFLSSLVEDQITGLFATLDATDIASKLHTLLNNAAALSTLKKSALSRATERFSLRQQAQANIALYQRAILSQPKKGPGC